MKEWRYYKMSSVNNYMTASMTITYPVGVACSAIMYFIIKQNGNFLKKVSD